MHTYLKLEFKASLGCTKPCLKNINFQIFSEHKLSKAVSIGRQQLSASKVYKCTIFLEPNPVFHIETEMEGLGKHDNLPVF